MAERTQRAHDQAKAPTPKDEAEEESKSQIELCADSDQEKEEKEEAKSDYRQSPEGKTDDDEMESAISRKSEATAISGETEKTQGKSHSGISASEISEGEELEIPAPGSERPKRDRVNQHHQKRVKRRRSFNRKEN